MTYKQYRIGDICKLEKGISPTLKTEPGCYPLVVTAEYRRTANMYQLEGPAVCIPLISSTGHGDAALHRVHYQDGKFALANLLVALLPKKDSFCDAKYLYHLLMTKKDEYFVPLMSGTANVSLKEKDIAEVEISLPPLPQQQRIVARIEALADKIEEARDNSAKNAEDLNRLLIFMAHRNDLNDREKAQNRWRKVKLEEVLKLVDDSQAVQANQSYPNLGIYSFGRGLFHKPPIDGTLTSAKTLRKIKKGQFIYSRLFAFEGAYGMTTDDFDGHFVSNEYPTFDCIASDIRVEFIMAYFKSPFIWQQVATGSKGLGDRRQRVKPERVLAHEAWLPPLKWQNQIAMVQRKVNDLKTLQTDTATAFGALLPSILDKAFKGEL